ncbi:DoxX family protein [Micromonospora sp. LH3U1]|uniref:DoxX family protein n=1 Tax=Micromonospora sp. LH3U1 TaxID=3018339 RepID=UPI00234B996D|nr:DoxX family protein [Micromonospora sp. LH3U1]WCN79082.1 DoxX family protein [Micromonospora sp. LH3U1]
MAPAARSPSPSPDHHTPGDPRWAELLGGLGLILPAATGIAPVLTPIAATCLAVVMVLAAITHIRRKESSGVAINAVLFLLRAFVAWGRFGPWNF